MTSMKQETLTQIMVDELTKGADGSDIKCGVIGEIGCTWPLQGMSMDNRIGMNIVMGLIKCGEI